nr:uncharacterized protein LOC129447318 [Misgurnus anguillicaudatus]
MQPSDEASWATPVRPKRHIRQPTYLQDYVTGVKPPTRSSPAPHSMPPFTPGGAEWIPRSHVRGTATTGTRNEFVPGSDESLRGTSLPLSQPQTSTPCNEARYTDDERDYSQWYEGSQQDCYDNSTEVRRQTPQQWTTSTKAQRLEQQKSYTDRWPIPPPAMTDDYSAMDEDEYYRDPPPPPWPTAEYPPMPRRDQEEHRVITIIDRMMKELQLMRNQTVLSTPAHARQHSAPQDSSQYKESRAPGYAQPRPQRSEYHLPTTNTGVRSYAQFPAQADTSPPHCSSGLPYSPGSMSLGRVQYQGPAPRIPLFVHKDPMEFSRLKLALTNLLPADAPELYKYQILVDHVKLEDACLIADSFINSPLPYTDTMAALTEKFGQPHHVALKRIASIMDTPEIKRGDVTAFEKFSLNVQSLVGMLQTLGPDGDVELRCGSHVARLLTKLPTEMRANFRRQMLHGPGHTHTLRDLAEWLRHESWCQGYDNLSDVYTATGPTGYRAEKRRSRPAATVLHGAEGRVPGQTGKQESHSSFKPTKKGKANPYCPYCENNDHFLNKCPEIQKLSREEIREWIRVNKRCWKCGRAHQAAQCDLKRLCDLCQERHLRILHDANMRPRVEPPKTESCLVSSGADILYLDRPSVHSRVLLKVVRVLLRNRDKTLDTYAVLDDGSERTMLLAEAAHKLGLQRKPEDLALRTIRHEVQTLKGSSVSFSISTPYCPKRTFRIADAFTSPCLALADHTYPIARLKKGYKHLADIPLEPLEHVKPLILIGADHPHLLTPIEPVILGPPGGPAAVHTRLGWTLQGPAHLMQCTTSTRQCLFTSISPQTELAQNVERLWKMDVLPYQNSKVVVRSRQDTEAVEILENKTRRVNVAGVLRYATPLLRKREHPSLRAPKEAILSSLRSLERRLEKNPQRASEYCEAIHKLVETGAVRKVDPQEAPLTEESWYIPHHLVSHNEKSRLVFNCSYQFQGRSLNDALLPGPTLGPSLLGVLLRFREHAVAVSGDIRSMFHQVRLLPEDCSLLRFLWRNMKRDQPPDIFEWQVLPFGTACSPCCAIFALQKHAREHGGPDERVRNSVEQCFYVDNCLQSVPTAEEARELVDQIREVLAAGGFEIRQWACNVPDVLKHLPGEARSDGMERWLSHNESGMAEPTLGLSWHWETDTLGYKSRPLDYGSLTMRNVYKVLARQYDPLGFISPFTTRAKLIVQSMWDGPRDWDDPIIPPDLQKAWMEWESELPLLSRITLPRPYAPAHTEQSVVSRQIHVFSDASEKAYGAVSYLRTEDGEGRVYLGFLAARSRVAPRRQCSIPRLELCGALSAAQLAQTIEKELSIKTDRTILWSDSTTVLTWLKSESCRFKVFVGTRIAEIQELTEQSEWRYVDSAQNPADDVTRGKTLAELAMPNRWSQGPTFLLKEPDKWPSWPCSETTQDLSEYKKVTTCGVMNRADRPDTLPVRSYLTWKDMVKSVAQQSHGAANQEPLTAADYKKAEMTIFRKVQSECFPEEMHHLKAGKALLKSSRILSLSPELDPDEDIIRVGGRLRRAEELDPSFKHPIVLDPSHSATKLLIQDYDSRLCHPGSERVFAELRRTFWVLRGREAIRKVQHQCEECRRWKSKPSIPKMSDLPAARLRLHKPPFFSTGVDCFGPFHVKLGRRSEKRWGIIYKCLTTRAVHLDILHSMDVDSFLMSLRRFVARRGNPAELYSDQGTNFRAGEKELYESFNSMSSDLQRILAAQKIDFRFNPPAAPHFGGTWEREIKSVKSALNTVIGAQSISEEVLHTTLLEVEAILNAKPLGYTSSDVADLDAVTPNVLLMGRLDGSLPPVVYQKSEKLSKRRWRHCQVMADHFWSRFIRDYLPSLQKRGKWHDTPLDLTVDSVVLLMDPQFPRALWPVGRVVKVHQSADGHVRSADVQVKDKIYTRPVARLITLPVISDDDDIHGAKPSSD